MTLVLWSPHQLITCWCTWHTAALGNYHIIQSLHHQYSGDQSKAEIYWNQTNYWPLSLSFLSSQTVSSFTEQSRPSQVLSQRHTHSSFSMIHAPLPEQSAGQPASVQWRPFQPVMQMQVPFLHWPCSSHLKGRQTQYWGTPLWTVDTQSKSLARQPSWMITGAGTLEQHKGKNPVAGTLEQHKGKNPVIFILYTCYLGCLSPEGLFCGPDNQKLPLNFKSKEQPKTFHIFLWESYV